MSEESKDIMQLTADLDDQINILAGQVIAEPDVDKTKDQLALFNWNLSKKNIARMLKLNGLYDDVTDQMILRFKTKADQFTNSDLIDYMKAVQGAIDVSAKNLSQVEQPPAIIQTNNTQVNINVTDSFDRDAKARILAAVQATLKMASAPIEQEPVVVVDDSVEVTTDGTTLKDEESK